MHFSEKDNKKYSTEYLNYIGTYDKNDILIVLIIVVAAALLIYTRINAIMDYPAQYAEENAATETKATYQITEPSEEADSEGDTSEGDEE